MFPQNAATVFEVSRLVFFISLKKFFTNVVVDGDGTNQHDCGSGKLPAGFCRFRPDF